jgi:Tfp pilus assembly protein PilF
VSADESNVDAMNNLAYNLAADRPDEALQYAQKALELGPDNPAAADTLGWIYYKKQIYPTAVYFFEKAVQKEGTAIRKYHLGLAYAKVGDTALARKNITEALQSNPKLALTEQVP